MKELRNQGDEAARIIQAHLQDGVEPPVGLSKHFEDFMKMVCTYYTKKDTVKINYYYYLRAGQSSLQTCKAHLREYCNDLLLLLLIFRCL